MVRGSYYYGSQCDVLARLLTCYVYTLYYTSIKIEMKGDRDGKSVKRSATRNCL